LIDNARERIKYWRLGRRSTLSPEEERTPRRDSIIVSQDALPVSSRYDWDRSDAFSQYLLMKVAGEPFVEEYRRGVLGQPGLLTEEARELARSPAAAYFPASWFRKHRVPVVGHSATVELKESERDRNGLYYIVDVYAEPPGAASRLKVRPQRFQEFAFPGEDGFMQRVRVLPWSVLGELLALGKLLVRSYPWSETMATWFVLTGEGQTVLPMDAQLEALDNEGFTYATVNLKVEPWVPADDVRRSYLSIQRRILGRKKRNPSERNVAVFFFVVGHCNPRGPERPWWSGEGGSKRPTWSTLCDLWNREHPERHRWHYKDWRNFQRDYGRAKKILVNPTYNLPGR
jgi:hypothetical protein